MYSQQSFLSNVAGSVLNSSTRGEGREGRFGNAHESIVPYQTFECKGGGVVVVGCGNDRQFREFKDLAGVEVGGLEGGSNGNRVENRDKLITLVEEAMMRRTRDEWGEVFEGAGFAFGPVRSVREGFECKQSVKAGMKVTLRDEGEGEDRMEMVVVNHPVKHSGVTDVKDWRRPPWRGEHTEGILGEIGFEEEAIERLRREGTVEVWGKEE